MKITNYKRFTKNGQNKVAIYPWRTHLSEWELGRRKEPNSKKVIGILSGCGLGCVWRCGHCTGLAQLHRQVLECHDAHFHITSRERKH